MTATVAWNWTKEKIVDNLRKKNEGILFSSKRFNHFLS